MAKTGPMKKITLKKKKELFLDKLGKNLGVISVTAKEVGINTKTFYDWCKKDEKFKRDAEEINLVQKGVVESSLLKNVVNGNVTAQIFYLKCKGRDMGYIETDDINLNVKQDIRFIWGEDIDGLENDDNKNDDN